MKRYILTAVLYWLLPLALLAQRADSLFETSFINLDLESENKDQNVSGLLRSNDDVFSSTAAYSFGTMFFRPRGYDSENSGVLINGAEVSNVENGRIVWSNWGGLNDVMRNRELYYGLTPDPYSMSDVGSMTYINTHASQYRKQVKVGYVLTDRMYRQRIMATASTGLMKNNWAVTVSGSRRWANEGYVEGTFYDAWAYFLAVEKKFGDKHSLNLTVFGAPTRRANQAANVQEVFDLVGTNYYNSNWGYQEGEKRSSRIKQFNTPVFILNYDYKISDKTKLDLNASYSFGKDSWTSLTWYNAPDPRPDYYRYLPSYQTDSVAKAYVTELWKNNENFRQIDWNAMYQANYIANSVGTQARYILENNINSTSRIGFNAALTHEANEHLTLNGRASLSIYEGEHYKVIDDLLGGIFWVDIDQYAERDFPGDSSIIQNDLNHPDRVVYEGDKFGYDYKANVNNFDLYGQAKFTYNKFDFYLDGSFGYTKFWRTGLYKNGRHPNNSYGESEKVDFYTGGVKGGLTWKINGRNFVTANGFYMTRAPYFTNSFISPRISNQVIPDLVNQKIYGGDLNYVVRVPWVNARVTYYYTRFLDMTDVTSFYHDDYLTYVYYAMSGLDTYHQGLEIGGEFKFPGVSFLQGFSVTAVAALGEYLITSRPTTTISFENGSQPDVTGTVYIKNFYVPGTPQTAYNLSLNYNYKFWYFEVSGNYFTDSWMDFTPIRRTEAAIADLHPDDPLIKTITQEQMLDGGFLLDASVGKSWQIAKKYYLNVNLSFSNILNNKDIQSGGYEQNRFDFETHNVDKFPPKYFYLYGRTFYLNLSFRI